MKDADGLPRNASIFVPMTKSRSSPTPFAFLRIVGLACLVSALATAAAAVVAAYRFADGAESMIQTLASVFLMAFLIALPTAFQAALIVAVAVPLMRRYVPGIVGRPLGLWLMLVLLAVVTAVGLSLLIAAVIGMPVFGGTTNDVTVVIVLCESIGGIVLGTMLARRLGGPIGRTARAA